jgi:hypothetical protein
VPYYRQFVQGIVESEWKAHDHHRRGNLDILFPTQQVVRPESKEGHVRGHRTAIDFYDSNIDLTGSVGARDSGRKRIVVKGVSRNRSCG